MMFKFTVSRIPCAPDSDFLVDEISDVKNITGVHVGRLCVAPLRTRRVRYAELPKFLMAGHCKPVRQRWKRLVVLTQKD